MNLFIICYKFIYSFTANVYLFYNGVYLLLNNLWAYFYTMLHLFIKLLMFIQVRWVFIYKIETKHQYKLNLGSLSSLPSLFASDAVGLSGGRMEIVWFGPNWSSSTDIGLLNEPSLCVFEECSLEKYSGNYNSLANGNHWQNKGQNRILQCNWRSDVELAAEFACSYVICSLAKNHQKETRNLSQLVGEERMLPRREGCGGTPKTGSTRLNLIMCKKNAYHFFICFVFATKLSWF